MIMYEAHPVLTFASWPTNLRNILLLSNLLHLQQKRNQFVNGQRFVLAESKIYIPTTWHGIVYTHTHTHSRTQNKGKYKEDKQIEISSTAKYWNRDICALTKCTNKTLLYEYNIVYFIFLLFIPSFASLYDYSSVAGVVVVVGAAAVAVGFLFFHSFFYCLAQNVTNTITAI